MLESKNLTCGYGQQFLLKNINFKCHEKEIVGIIGPNGSGKTTLLKAITKVIKIKSGAILFENKKISAMNYLELARNIAVVSGDAQVQFDLSVEEFVALGRIPYQDRFQFVESKHDIEIINAVMKLTNTLSLAKRSMKSLSAGENQLVVIARALAQQPKLLLLDEPTVYLDISHQVEILDLLRRLNRQKGLSVILVLHELNLASEYCDRLILLNKGSIHCAGTPKEVLDYRIIEEVYKTTVVVEENPVSHKPCVLIVTEEEKNRGF